MMSGVKKKRRRRPTHSYDDGLGRVPPGHDRGNLEELMSEAQIQKSVIEYLDRYCKLKGYIFHIDNGGKMSPAMGQLKKDMGVRPGVGDLGVMMRGGRFGFIEMKTGTRKQSQEQKDFEEICIMLRFPYEIARSLDDVIDILKNWGCL